MKKSTILKNISIFSLALALVLSPGLASAKDNNNDNNREMRNNSCPRAFGHLIAPGWFKVNAKGSIKVGEHCKLPFGISKKINNDENNNGSGNQDDHTPPVISNTNELINSTNAIVTFTTNEKASANVYYGTSAGVDVNNSATLKVSQSSFTKLHSLLLSSLSANTKYYVVIQAKDENGNVTTGTEFNFTTKAATDTVAPVITNVTYSATSSGITVSWTTNEASSSKVFYATTTPVNVSSSSTSSVEGSGSTTSHSVNIPSLSANTQYYLVVQSKDASNNVSSSTEFGVKTSM